MLTGRASYQIELSNRIERGRCVGNAYGVTRRPLGFCGFLFVSHMRDEHAARAECEQFIADREAENARIQEAK